MSQDAVMNALVASLAATLPGRHVQRALIDPAREDLARLEAGVICLVVEGGGGFANYLGREGELGQLRVKAIGFVKVAEDSTPDAVEAAELALLNDLLAWTGARALSWDPVDVVLPGDWAGSRQLEHPYGWLVLALKVR